LVRVEKNKPFPADLLILRSEGDDGFCYVETKSLDGETNLKLKKAPKDINTSIKDVEDIGDIVDGTFVVDPPN